MRIVVDRMPDTPRDCLFSEKITVHGDTFYRCTLRPYIEDADIRSGGYKPLCVCRNTSNCNNLALEML